MTWTLKANITGATGPAGATATPTIATTGAQWTPTAYVAGNYYFCNSAHYGTAADNMPNNMVNVFAWSVTASITITRLFMEITTSGQTGSVVRLGIWNDTGYGHPGTLLLEAGTLAGDASPGVYEITVSQAISPGLYWVGGVAQNAATAGPHVRGTNPYGSGSVVSATSTTTLPLLGNSAGAYAGGTMTGALGDLTSFAGFGFTNQPTPRIGFKVAP